MPEALPYIAAAVATLGLWWAGMTRLGVFMPEDVRAWRRLAVLRGYSLSETRVERAARASRWLQRAQRELDLESQLARACRPDTPLGFVGKTAALALFVFAFCLLLDALARAVTGAWPAPPWLAPALAAAIFPLAVVELRAAARRTTAAAAGTVGDMLMQLAVITDTRGLQPQDAVLMLSRCARDPSLRHLLEQEAYRRLAPGRYRSTVELYRAVAAAYDIDVLGQLADALATTHVGVPEREAFTRLALAVASQRLSDARMRVARAKVTVTLPVAAMLIPLLLLIAAPTFQAITAGVGGG